MPFLKTRRESIREKLRLLYGDRADDVLVQLERLGDGLPPPRRRSTPWTERDAVLITYADIVRSHDASPLETLRRFLLQLGLERALTTVHLLPFFPYTSDDGFSVVDYRAVDPQNGTWDDVDRLSMRFDLMFDLVLNHCSQASDWFQGYLRGDEPYCRFFIAADPDDPALAAVTRPRSLPLLTEFATSRGRRHIWTTFSSDQVDLNYADPDVLVAMCDILLEYARRGARIIRFDAIAFLWKRIGTSCVHLPETHAVVKIMRMLLDEFAPGTLLLTETNVPHRENVSYFGDNDEAHLVYQFSLAPLLLDAFLTRDPTPLNRWLRNLESPQAGTTYFNFAASHDGIGVRPLEGLVDVSRRDRLVAEIERRGGRVSMKRNSNGSDSPYELNTTLFTALGEPDANGEEDVGIAVRRMIALHAVMLGLQGIPGLYYHSLFGIPDWQEGVEQTGRSRTINRRKFDADELASIVTDETSHHVKVLIGLTKLLTIRAETSAFHPDANQTIPTHSTPGLIAFLRTSLDGDRRVLVLCNVSDRPMALNLSAFANSAGGIDLITGQSYGNDPTIPQESTLWLELS